MKICLITPTYDPIKRRGVNEINLSRGLKELGLDVDVICTKKNSFNLKVGATHFPINKSLSKQILRLSPDIVHVSEHFQPASQIAFTICKLKGIPFIITQHMYGRLQNKFKYPFMFYERVTAVPILFGKKIIAVSNATKLSLFNLGVPIEKIAVIPTGIDTNFFNPKNVHKRVFREEFGIESDEKIILTIASLLKIKGLDYLIKACSEVKKNKLEFKLIIIGRGPEKQNLLNIIKKYGLGRNCILLDHHFPKQQLPSIYKAADLFVLPSTYEILGNVLIEATSMGTPIICSNVGGMTDVVKNGVNGLIVPPADPYALAKAIIKVLNNPELSQKMGDEGRCIAESKFNYLVTAKQTLEVYKKAC